MAKIKKQNLYIFGWPSFISDSGKKIADLLELLYKNYNITVIPINEDDINDSIWTAYLRERKISYCLEKDLDEVLSGIAISFGESLFFKNKIHRKCVARGLKVFWSPETNYKHEDEDEALKYGEINKILLVSEFQKNIINYDQSVNTFITGTWINPNNFSLFEKNETDVFNIGRISSSELFKYPENFPNFYNFLVEGVSGGKIRVSGWSEELKNKWTWFTPDPNIWSLLKEGEEPSNFFYNTLDVLVYSTHHTYKESYCRNLIEAQLCGVPIVIEKGHNLDSLLIDKKTAFIVNCIEEFKTFVNVLYSDPQVYRGMSANAILHANELMKREKHLALWKEALNDK